MPSGYTYKINEGKEAVTGRSFIMDCAKAFGACVSMRDDSSNAPIPEEFKPSPYHLEQLEVSRSKLAEAINLSFEDCEKAVKINYEGSLRDKKEALTSKQKMRNRYLKVLEEVNTWEIPSDEHKRLKEFAVKQLEESIDWDCNTSYYTDHEIEIEDVHGYREQQIERFQKDIEYYTKGNQEEIDRTNERNLWIKQLRNSL